MQRRSLTSVSQCDGGGCDARDRRLGFRVVVDIVLETARPRIAPLLQCDCGSGDYETWKQRNPMKNSPTPLPPHAQRREHRRPPRAQYITRKVMP
ncbi:hypothetical protein [Lysobacter gummosus]|uniref:hypothetical protein n=1 Tax=Lysobacter gummosus TaxID=262324 RepID=UPI00363DFCC0